jgi:solute carrier family 25 (mitochondrial citrate transporter), member 1
MVRKSSDPLVAGTSGAIAGGIETCIVWPMEYIKTQLQLQLKTKNPKYTGIVSCARYTIRNTGFFSFYRGMLVTLIGSIPKAGIRFGGVSQVKNLLRKEDGSLTAGRTLLAGMTAGAIEATVAVTPAETIKTRLIDGNNGMVRGMVNIFKNEGIRGFYLGWGPTVAKQSSNVGLRFMAFDQYKRVLSNGGEKELKSYEQFFGGMCSGCFSTMCNNPFDMVKTRMQGLEANRYNGVLDCINQVIKKEGVLSFWKGVGPRLSRVVPGQGVIFMSYEQIQSIVESKLKRGE